MLNVNDFKLVPLEALVHDEALFKSYLEFITAVGEIYDIEHENMLGEIDLGDDYIWEDQVLFKEVGFWLESQTQPTITQFLDWVSTRNGYWSPYESDTPETFKLFSDLLVRNSDGAVLGRAQQYSGLDKGKWISMGFDCIHPDHRREGLGRVIMAHRLNRAKENGIDEIKLNSKTCNMGSMRRMQKLEEAGLSLREKFAGRSSWERKIVWFSLPENLDQAYEILTAPHNDAAPEV